MALVLAVGADRSGSAQGYQAGKILKRLIPGTYIGAEHVKGELHCA